MSDPHQTLEAVRAMMTVCIEVADETKALPPEKVRMAVILVYQSDDASAHAVAGAVLGAAGKEMQEPSGPAGMALLAHHGVVVRELRAAGYEISDPEDPGAGRVPVIFIVGRECIRNSMETDPAAAARHDALMADLNDLPEEAYPACKDALDRAAAMSDTYRRQCGAIAVCQCNDPRARQAIAAFARAAGQAVEPEADKAISAIYDHDEVVNIARGLGYEVAPLPDPEVGRMRVFFFVRGRCIATDMQVVSEEQVLRDQQADEDRNVAEAKRIFEEKQGLISHAIAVLQATPGLLETRVVVVFACRSTAALKAYADIVALPEMRDFPKELPAKGARVVTMGYDDFTRIVRPYDAVPSGNAASPLGPGEARIAIFTTGGIFFQKTKVTRLSRGGSA